MRWNQLTTQSFIEKAKLVHGNKFDYSKTEYVNSRTKVIIVCPKHGEFVQLPSSHLQGNGCPYCAREWSQAHRKHLQESARKSRGMTTEEWIRRAKLVHVYIELNASWVHGGHWYDSSDTKDSDRLHVWQQKVNDGHCFYEVAIHVWTVRDILKRDTALQNHLNYLVFWDNNLSDFKDWFNSDHSCLNNII